jgi:CheY-like chemotaxis protein
MSSPHFGQRGGQMAAIGDFDMGLTDILIQHDDTISKETQSIQHKKFGSGSRNLCSLCNLTAVRRGSVRVNENVPVILVIEDDDAIQGVVEDALSEGGFEPAIAASGEEAVTLLIGQKTKYRALVTDISLKGKLNGWEVAQKAREIDPGFPIVYISGASAADWPAKGVPNSLMLAKPFAPAQLVTAVSQLLNSGAPTT